MMSGISRIASISLCNIMGGGERIPAMNEASDPGQNVYLHAVVDLGR
jgi:hypothetical protein